MADNMLSIPDADRIAMPTLSKLSENDIDSIWTSVYEFVQGQMSLQKGVYIHGLGTFTWSQQKIDMGNKVILIQRPIFQLSEKVSQKHGLKQVKMLAAGDVPVVPLNYTALSWGTPFDRDTVERCIHETLLLLYRCIASQRSTHFNFHGIGVLSLRQGTAKMRFYKDFLNAMDGSGNLTQAFLNRPGTCDSVISGRALTQQRPGTSNSVLLPRMKLREPSSEQGMQPITEERVTVDQEQHKLPTEVASPRPLESAVTEAQGPREPQEMRQRIRRPALQPGRVTGISIHEELDRSLMPTTADERQADKGRRLGFSLPSRGHVPELEQKANTLLVSSPPVPLGSECADHDHAGQELCYVCMQRAQRNVPVYLSEERRRQEKEDERLLMLHQQQKEQEELQKEQAGLQDTREKKQEIAAFNLGVSEATKGRKPASSMQVHNSYIFQNRPPTPPHQPKQRRYLQELSEQISQRKETEAQGRKSQELRDHLRQVQLAQEIAALKEQNWKKKAEQIQNYHKALDMQVKVKPSGLPACESDSEGLIFGAFDSSNKNLQEQRKRAHQLYQEQLETATQKKREALFNHILEQKKEQEVLKRTRKELVADRIARHEKLHSMRASLEDNWAHSADAKCFREQEEHSFIRSGSRQLMDQCEKYRRCYQCKRRTTNRGESNIWKDSRYIPGSRLMI
ncbi:coiled-coil domain-containing protein 81 isoform X1 [Amia ocellicauda]|uniref:coiled-coil domain-containing protein 81 isoform X1 n=1 Tax=Amia ocellicauda TaxID=2972642 RepID=UPI003464CB89